MIEAQLEINDGSGWQEVPGATESPAVIDGLEVATEYSVRVRYSRDGESVYSNVLVASTDSPPPLAPGSLLTEMVGPNGVLVSWTDSTGGFLPVSFALEYREVGAPAWLPATGTSPLEITGLAPETDYEIRGTWTDSDSPATAVSDTIQVTTSSAIEYLLQDYPGAAGAYSLSLLSDSYNGPAIRIRNSLDAEQDINFNVLGDLDVLALEDFAGGSEATVVMWYDQSGNGRHLDAASPGNAPAVTDGNGSFLGYIKGNNNAHVFEAPDEVVSADSSGSFSVFLVARSDENQDNSNTGYLLGNTNSLTSGFALLERSGRIYLTDGTDEAGLSVDSIAHSPGNKEIYTFDYDNNSVIMSVNGVVGGTNAHTYDFQSANGQLNLFNTDANRTTERVNRAEIFTLVLYPVSKAADRASISSALNRLNPVVSAPAILQQPVDDIAYENNDAVFEVVANDEPNWFRWETSADGTTWSDVPGGDTATLTVTASLANDGHLFRCVVANLDSEIVSNEVALTTVPDAPGWLLYTGEWDDINTWLDTEIWVDD